MVDWPFAVSDGAYGEVGHSVCLKDVYLARARGGLTPALDVNTENRHEKIMILSL